MLLYVGIHVHIMFIHFLITYTTVNVRWEQCCCHLCYHLCCLFCCHCLFPRTEPQEIGYQLAIMQFWLQTITGSFDMKMVNLIVSNLYFFIFHLVLSLNITLILFQISTNFHPSSVALQLLSIPTTLHETPIVAKVIYKLFYYPSSVSCFFFNISLVKNNKPTGGKA